MKKVLLIGDSIRISYQDEVTRLLEGKAEVLSPAENCRYSKFALWGMHAWLLQLGNPKVDVVHWNAGIWDLHRVTADGEVFTPPDEYIRYTERLYAQMKHTALRQIWASTTPCGRNYTASPQWSDNSPKKMGQNPFTAEAWNRDVVKYNQLAMVVLQAKGDVAFNDLHGAIQSNPDLYIGNDGIHLTTLGAQAAAKQVAECIRALL